MNLLLNANTTTRHNPLFPTSLRFSLKSHSHIYRFFSLSPLNPSPRTKTPRYPSLSFGFQWTAPQTTTPPPPPPPPHPLPPHCLLSLPRLRNCFPTPLGQPPLLHPWRSIGHSSSSNPTTPIQRSKLPEKSDASLKLPNGVAASWPKLLSRSFKCSSLTGMSLSTSPPFLRSSISLLKMKSKGIP